MSINKTGSSTKAYPEGIKQKLFEILGEDLKTGEVLAPHTTFRIGGPADFFYPASTPEELIKGINTAKELDLPYFVLGGGSNLLISDSGFRGLMIKNLCRKILIQENKVSAQSGTSLAELVDLSLETGLSGLEFAAGIYGTLGGAVYGNAGAFGRAICEVLDEGILLTSKGSLEIVNRDYFEFDYRHSKLKSSKDVLLSATLILQKEDKEKIRKKIEENLKVRKARLPEVEGCAGSFFKNIKSSKTCSSGVSAGFLLEQVGAKQLSVGDARIFSKHANIIINSGKATSEQVRALARILKEKVKEKFNIELEEEVIYLGN